MTRSKQLLAAIGRLLRISLVLTAIIVAAVVALVIFAGSPNGIDCRSGNSPPILPANNITIDLRIVQDNTNTPIQGANVTASNTLLCYGIQTRWTSESYSTNASGQVNLYPKYYVNAFNVQYGGKIYSFNDEVCQFLCVEYITFSIPSGTIVSTNTTKLYEDSCSTQFQNGLNPPISSSPFHINENTSLVVCVKYFYFNPNATKTFDFSRGQQIAQISGFSGQASFDASSNFTVSTSISSVTFGGNSSLSEGTVVMYTISPRHGINGTYAFNFGVLYPSLEACGVDFLLSIGSGLPNYSYTAGCTAPLSNFYPTNSEGDVDGFLLSQIIGISNNTQ